MKSNQQKFHLILGLMLIIGLFSLHNAGHLGNNHSDAIEQTRSISELKSSGTYENITIDNLPGSWNNWTWAESQIWCSGLGTINNPYIIQGHTLGIDSVFDGIEIRNSNDIYFIIENCTFFWDGFLKNGFETAIELINVTDGRLNDNLIYGMSNGIQLTQCEDVLITNNTVYNTMGGIHIFQSDYIELAGNTVNGTENGISVSQGENNEIVNNTVYNNEYGMYITSSEFNKVLNNDANNNNVAGIYLYFCDNNTVSGNMVNNNTDGIYLEENNDNVISGNTANENSQNGIYSYFCDYNNITGNTVDNNYDGIYLEDDCNNNIISGTTATDNVNGIVLDDSNNNTLSGNSACNNNNNGIYVSNNCTNITISGNIANNNEVGMYIYNCHYNIITGNTANNNVDREGIVLDGSNDNIISGNTIDGNEVGIFIYDALNNTFIGNTISNNNVSGIHIDEDSDYNEFTENIVRNNTIGLNIASLNDNNLVYKNFFLENGIHAYDDGTDNQWNNTVIGNYWDNLTGPDVSPPDGIVDNPYIYISGPAGSIDYLPIAEDGPPQITIHSPSAINRFGSTAPSFNVEVTDDYLFEMWYSIDGGLHNYTFTENGTIDQSAWNTLPDGSVTITFYAIDMAGNIGIAEITIGKNLPEEFDPTLVIVIVSIVGGAALLGAILFILEKRGKISLEKIKKLSFRKN